MLFQRGFGHGETFGHALQFIGRRVAAFLGLGDFTQGAGILGINFPEAFLVVLDAAVVALDLRLQFHPALLLRGDLMFQLGQEFAQLGDFTFVAENVIGALVNLAPQIFQRLLAFGDFPLQHVELVACELGFQMLQFL